MIYKKTKIVCTLGPATSTHAKIKELIQSGMDVARLNFSHGTHEEKKEKIDIVRKVSEELKKPIAIIADLSGPKIRLGSIEGIRSIKSGDKIHLTINPVEDELPMQFDLSPYVKKGQRIFLNDGLVELIVTGTAGSVVKTEAQNAGWVSSHKGVNIPDTLLTDSVFTDKDQEDAQFALKNKVDYIALSFIQTPKDMEKARKLIQKLNPQTKIIVKVEKKEAIKNLEEIIKLTDAVMVARGDLGIETNASEVPLVQKRMINLCRQFQKPVIVATQMLESMIENPRPTRAETSDVANAVLDQVDAVMLSAESASGKYPVEAVETMSSIIMSVEANPMFNHYIKIDWSNIIPQDISINAITSSAAALAYKMNSKIIAAATASGKTARLVSSFRPNAKVIAFTHDKQTCNQLALVWGVTPFVLNPTKNSDTFWQNIVTLLSDHKFLLKGEKAVLIGGSTEVGLSGATDTIKVVTA